VDGTRRTVVDLWFDPEYRRPREASRGGAKVATGVCVNFRPEVLHAFYPAFGTKISDVWPRPSTAEYHEVIRSALAEVSLPADVEHAMESDEYDFPLCESHDAGTPITAVDGALARRISPALRAEAQQSAFPIFT
jgi:hypothetical protein